MIEYTPPPPGQKEIDWWFYSPWQTAKDIWNWGGDSPAEEKVRKKIYKEAEWSRKYEPQILPEGKSEQLIQMELRIQKGKEYLEYHYQYGNKNTMNDASAYRTWMYVQLFGPNGVLWQLLPAFGGGGPGPMPPQPNQPIATSTK